MNWLIGIFTNHFLITGLSSWLLAQIVKLIIYAIVHKKIDFKRIFGDGGMPSGHSATVCALATYAAVIYGTTSFQFATTAILALIVCHDAMGVRRETGKQAAILNEIRKSTKDGSLESVKLKELVGHTPGQVIVGGLLGIANALVWSVVWSVL